MGKRTQVTLAQIWEDTDSRHTGRRVEVTEVGTMHADVALMTGRTWPGHQESQRTDDRRAEPGRITRVSLDAFTGQRPRYRLIEQPGTPCGYCQRFGTGPAEDGPAEDGMAGCECSRWCGAAKCCDTPERRAREIAWAHGPQGGKSLPPELVHGDLVDVEVRVIGPAGPARAVLDRILAALDAGDVSGPIPARGPAGRVRWYVRQAVPRE